MGLKNWSLMSISIPTPRMRSDCISLMIGCLCTYFNPHSSYEERLGSVTASTIKSRISIHTPRMRSDRLLRFR